MPGMLNWTKAKMYEIIPNRNIRYKFLNTSFQFIRENVIIAGLK
jgi:hypothetical protein